MSLAKRLQQYLRRQRLPYEAIAATLAQRFGVTVSYIHQVMARLRQADAITYYKKDAIYCITVVAPVGQSLRRCPVCDFPHYRRAGHRDTAICGDCDAQCEQDGTRYCRQCQTVKPMAKFMRHRQCRDCHNAYQRDYNAAKPRNREHSQASTRAYRATLRERGLCEACGAPTRGKRHCPACLRIRAERARIKAEKRRAAGLCVACGQPCDRDGIRCARCVAREKERARRRRAEKEG